MFENDDLIEFSIYMRGPDDEMPNEELPEDPLQKLLGDCELAGLLGNADLEELRKETQELDARAERLRKIAAAQKRNVSDGALLEKRYSNSSIHKGEIAARFEKSENGRWMFEYGETGNLLRGYEIEG